MTQCRDMVRFVPDERSPLHNTAIVRPILEYASPVWHLSLTVAQSETLESMQKRALRIIYEDQTLIVADIDSLETRREQLKQVLDT